MEESQLNRSERIAISTTNISTAADILKGQSKERLDDFVVLADSLLYIPLLDKNLSPGESFSIAVKVQGFLSRDFLIVPLLTVSDSADFVAGLQSSAERVRLDVLRNPGAWNETVASAAASPEEFAQLILSPFRDGGIIGKRVGEPVGTTDSATRKNRLVGPSTPTESATIPGLQASSGPPQIPLGPPGGGSPPDDPNPLVCIARRLAGGVLQTRVGRLMHRHARSLGAP